QPQAPKAGEEAAPERAAEPAGPFAHILKSFTGRQPVINDGSEAALEIAAETKDFVERRTALALGPARHEEREPKPASLVAQASSELEGQVSGLRKRRSGKLG